MSPFGAFKSKAPTNGIFSQIMGKPTDWEEYPLLPLRELVIFPQTMMSVYITYKSGINALEEALGRDLRLFAVCIKNPETTDRKSANQKSTNQKSTDHRSTDYKSDETWDAGTVVRIVQNLRLPDNTFRVVLQGEYRAILASSRLKDSSLVRVRPIKASDAIGGIKDPSQEKESLGSITPEISALMRAVQKSFAQYAEFSKKISTEIISAVEKTENAERLVNLIGNTMAIKPDRKIDLIRIADPGDRLEKLLETLELENEIFGIQKNISGKVKSRMEKTQREYILNEQLREINKELGKDAAEDEFSELERNIKERRPGEEVIAKTRKEIARLRRLQPFSPEAGVLRGYLEWVVDLPWSEYSTDSTDLAEAERILNEDHYAMKKAKERIIEFIAVSQLLSGEWGYGAAESGSGDQGLSLESVTDCQHAQTADKNPQSPIPDAATPQPQ